jgi:hypothetical protein
LFTRSTRVHASGFRKIAHQLSDYIYEALLGENGSFTTAAGISASKRPERSRLSWIIFEISLSCDLLPISLNFIKHSHSFAMTIFHKITKSAKLVILLIIPTYAKVSSKWLMLVLIFAMGNTHAVLEVTVIKKDENAFPIAISPFKLIGNKSQDKDISKIIHSLHQSQKY